jgi:hypothetical protein
MQRHYLRLGWTQEQGPTLAPSEPWYRAKFSLRHALVALPLMLLILVGVTASGRQEPPAQPKSAAYASPAEQQQLNAIRISPNELYDAFKANEDAANSKYGGALLCVHGTVTQHPKVHLVDGEHDAPCFPIQSALGAGQHFKPSRKKLTVCWNQPMSVPGHRAGDDIRLICSTPTDGSMGVLMDDVIIHGCAVEDARCPLEAPPPAKPRIQLKSRESLLKTQTAPTVRRQ